MKLLLGILPLFLATAGWGAAGPTKSEAVETDGGEVPIAAPKLTPRVAPILAPELVSDGGQSSPDGGEATLVAPETLSVYQVDIPAEAALTVGSFGLYLMADILIKPTLQGDISCGGGICNPNTLSSFDRYAIGKSSLAWGAFSDVALAASVAIPVLYLGLESLVLPTKEPLKDWARDLLVITEAIAMTAGIDTVLKFAFRRPRPDRYLPLPAGTAYTFDDELSLPSGHAAVVMAATTALTTTIFFRHPHSKVRYIALATGVVLTALTAFARVQSGNHFPTDTITGVIVGAFAGFVVPYMHRTPFKVQPSVAYNPATGATMFSVAGAL